MIKKLVPYISCFVAGIINGLLGAGGGMLIVPMLVRSGIDTKRAHAASVCIILPMCVFSAVLYIVSKRVVITDAIVYIICGVLGAFMGTWVLYRISANLLRKVFSLFMLWAAYRLLVQ